jgi:putative hemolysin
VFVQFLPAGQAATGSTVFTSLFVITFGEIAPKSSAVAHAEKHALRFSRPIIFIQRLLRPILYVFEVVTGALNRFTGGESNIESYMSREEIETIVLSGETSGVLDTDEGAMIRSVLDLEKTIVRGVMVSRSEIVSVPDSATLDDVVRTCWQEHVVRLPVYGESRADVTGIFELRDALRAREEDGSLADVTTEPHFVPGTKPVDEVLTEMQSEGHRMVIVVDEFGTVTGLATLEDVIEEVVGEIFGHHETDPIRSVDANTAVVDGWATVVYVSESLGIDLPSDGPFETVAGLVTHQLGRLAEEGDRVELPGVVITVLDGTQRRIRRVRIEWTEQGSATEKTEKA